ncbi:MAG: hypothetical protein EZS28_006505 [Streblomastix strix]|uniref:Uncharacterized protein n=1 Tax=Streblomastix strix TaxID=222440 RepID=A0A5J4WS58_9EUKA|nr:MAG: hypothetical protein EZS28_006505 [Streblomastix strix]
MAWANDFWTGRKLYHQQELFLQQRATFWSGLRNQKDSSAELGRICLKLLLCPISEAHSEREFSDLCRKLGHLRSSLDIQRLLTKKTLAVSGELPEIPKVANAKNKSLNTAYKTSTTTTGALTQRLDVRTDGNSLMTSKLSTSAARDLQSESKTYDKRDTLPLKPKAVAKTRAKNKHKMSDGKKNGIKENCIILPESIIHDENYEQTKTKFAYPPVPEGFWELIYLSNLWDILNIWNVDLRQDDYIKEKQVIQADGTSIPMNEKLINTIAEGFKGIQIHNYATKSSDEVKLLLLFQSLNVLKQFISADKIEELCDKIHSIANLFAKATQHWSDIKAKVGNDAGCNKLWLLVTYFKNFNRKYYNETLKKCIFDHMKQQEEEKRRKQKIQLRNSTSKQLINLKDKFLLMPEIQEKAIKVGCQR